MPLKRFVPGLVETLIWRLPADCWITAGLHLEFLYRVDGRQEDIEVEVSRRYC